MKNSNYYVSYTGPCTNISTVFHSYSQTFRNIGIPTQTLENCQNLQSYEKPMLKTFDKNIVQK